jgi:hypothetical protein
MGPILTGLSPRRLFLLGKVVAIDVKFNWNSMLTDIAAAAERLFSDVFIAERYLPASHNERGRHHGGTPSQTTYGEILCALPLLASLPLPLPQGRYQRAGCPRQLNDVAVLRRSHHHDGLPRMCP